MSFNCKNCGTELEDSAIVCTNCGQAVHKPAQAGLNKKEFFKLPELTGWRKELNAVSYFLYFCAAVTLIVNLITGSLLAGLVDVLLLAGLGLWNQLTHSRVCAIVITVYGAINCIYTTLASGRLSGWLPLVAGIIAISYSFKFQKAWKKYQETGEVPEDAEVLFTNKKKKK